MIKMIHKLRRDIDMILLSLFVFAFLSNTLNVFVGLTITPCIIMGFIIAIRNFKKGLFLKRTFSKPVIIPFLLFLLSILIGTFFSYNALSTGKILIKLIVLVFIFWQFYIFYTSLNQRRATKTIEITVLAYGIISASLFVSGLIALGFNFNVENTRVLGVMVDRMMPRLISLASIDPNITSAYLSIIIAFLISQRRSRLNTINLVMFMTLNLLTLSRGGIIALVILLTIHAIVYIAKNKKYKLGVVAFLVLCISVASCIWIGHTEWGSHTIIGTITGRFDDSLSDGGSGRLKIWEKSIETLRDHPIIGIGANNTLAYNTEQYGLPKYTHNSYLEIISETGIIGALAFIAFSVQLFRRSILYFDKSSFPLYALITVFVNCLFLSLVYTEILIFAVSPMLFIDVRRQNGGKQ